VSRDRGVPAHLIEDAGDLDVGWLAGVGTVGLTSGASAPEELVEGVIAWFRDRGELTVDTVMVVDEDVEFAMPSVLARRLRELAGEDPDGGGADGQDPDGQDAPGASDVPAASAASLDPPGR
jgi:hypothetical protein